MNPPAAENLANGLIAQGVSVFYDKYEQSNLWGKDLYQHLSSIYRDRAIFCIIFISSHYEKKLWTRHELKQAQARAFSENTEYILPVRIDDTEIPGVLETTGYIDYRDCSTTRLLDLILQKLDTYRKLDASNSPKIINNDLDSSKIQSRTTVASFAKLLLPSEAKHLLFEKIADQRSSNHLSAFLAFEGNAALLLSLAPAGDQLSDFAIANKFHIGHAYMAKIFNWLKIIARQNSVAAYLLPPFNYISRGKLNPLEELKFTNSLSAAWQRILMLDSPVLSIEVELINGTAKNLLESKRFIKRASLAMAGIKKSISLTDGEKIELLAWRQGKLSSSTSTSLEKLTKRGLDALPNISRLTPDINGILSVLYVIFWKYEDYGPSEWLHFVFNMSTLNESFYILEADKNQYAWEAADFLLKNYADRSFPPRIYLRSLLNRENTPVKGSIDPSLNIASWSKSSSQFFRDPQYLKYLLTSFGCSSRDDFAEYINTFSHSLEE